MKNIDKIILLFILICSANVYAQCPVDETWKLDQIKVNSDKRSKKYFRKKSRSISIIFYEKFNDSMIVCVDRQLVHQEFVTSWLYATSKNDTLNGSKSMLRLYFSSKHRRIKFLLPETKRYIKFKILSNYSILFVYKIDEVWVLKFTNQKN